MAKADEILETSRRERGHDAPVTSDQQGSAVGDYLEHSDAPEDYDAVADLFQSEADQRAF